FFVGNYFMSRVGFGIVHDLRAELFQKLHDLLSNNPRFIRYHPSIRAMGDLVPSTEDYWSLASLVTV
ncbi:MAG: hypothetical protein ACPHL6_12895, partial [Rubripirellula sp.]